MKKPMLTTWRAALALPFAVLAACEHPSGPPAVLHPKPADQIDATSERLGVQPVELAAARAALDALVTASSGPGLTRLEAPTLELTRALRTLSLIQAQPVRVEVFEDLSAQARRLDAVEAARGRRRGRP